MTIIVKTHQPDPTLTIPGIEGITVECLVVASAIPVHTEIDGGILVIDHLTCLCTPLRALVGRPELITPATGNHIGSHTSAIVLAGTSTLEENLASTRIVKIPRIGTFLLMHLEHLHTVAVRIHLTQMDGIAVTETCGIEQLAVIVEGCRAPDNLVAPIAIDITHREIMIAITIHGVTTLASDGSWCRDLGRLLHILIHHRVGSLGVRAMQPTVLEQTAVEIDCPDIGIGIIAATEDTTRFGIGTTQVGHGSEITLTTVAIVATVFLTAAVVPVKGTLGLAEFGLGITIREIGDGMDGSARHTIKDGQVFMSTVDTTGSGTPVLRIVGLLDSLVGSGLVHVVSYAVLRAGSGLADQFSPSVTIEVVDHKLRIVGTGTNVHTEVDTPEFRAVQFVTVEVHIIRLVTL